MTKKSYKLEQHGKIILLEFNSYTSMCKTLLRPQEYWEHPDFMGETFTVEDYVDYIRVAEQKEFKFNDWAGACMPGEIFEPFFNRVGKFKKWTKEEKILLNDLKQFRDEKYFLVATKKGDTPTLVHEVAHAQFHLSPVYRKRVKSILKELKPEYKRVMSNSLRKDHYYAPFRYTDELHAYLIDGIDKYIPMCSYKISKEMKKECRKVGKKLRDNFWNNKVDL